MTEPVMSRFQGKLPAWARRGDPRWIIGAVVGAVVVFCCCCGLGFAALSKGGDDSDDSGKHRSSSSAAASNRESSSPSGSPSPSESKRDADEGAKKSTDDKTKPVPNVVGKNAAVAADELKRAGFSKVRFAAGDGQHKIVVVPQNWEVTKQSAPAGSSLRIDAVLVLTCKKVS